MKLGNIVLDKDEYSVDEVMSLANKYADSRVGSIVAEKAAISSEVDKLKSELDTLKSGFDAEKVSLVTEKDRVIAELESKLASEVDAVRGEFSSKFEEQFNILKAKAGEKLVGLVEDLPGDVSDKVSYLLKHQDDLFGRSGSVGFGVEAAGVGDGGVDIVAKVKAMDAVSRGAFLSDADNYNAVQAAVGSDTEALHNIIFGG